MRYPARRPPPRSRARLLPEAQQHNDPTLVGEPLDEPPAPETCGTCTRPVTICACGGDVAEFDDGARW